MTIASQTLVTDVHINWEGPFTKLEASNLNSTADHGLYQFYGEHLIYGSDTLLYFGKAQELTFGNRISVQNWDVWSSNTIQIYIGKIFSKSILEEQVWLNQIDLSEKIILQSHGPAFNSSNINKIGYIGEDIRIFNWGTRRLLLPEVSVSRCEGKHAVGNKLKAEFLAQHKVLAAAPPELQAATIE
ncbi:MAG: hypothetical protein ABI212_10795 [Burkholderiaceae bacterium]